jgi:Asp-tRNA(Asn)/Glu-tRNA(Gln) amidotransferase B subunit
MSEERARILKMVAEGKISVKEAEELLDALKEKTGQAEQAHAAGNGPVKNPKYLFVKVTSDKDNVNVRVPFGLLRAGMKFTSLIPPMAMQQINQHMHDKGINLDLNNIRPQDLDELVTSLADMEVNVESKDGEKVRVYSE